MRFSSALLGLSTIIVQITGSLGSPLEALPDNVNPTCQGSPCLYEVRSNRHLGSAHGKPGCTSFFRSTVTPTPSTTHITHSVTVRKTATVTSTDVEPETSTKTAHVTATVFKTLTVATVTTTPGKIAARAEATTSNFCPTTHGPANKIPAFATGCANPAEFSSACSCVSVSHLTRTAPTCTTVLTDTKTVQVTSTSTDYVTKRTVVATKTVTNTDTVTSTELVTSTITAEATCTAVPSEFQLQITGGLFTDQTLSAGILAGSQFPVLLPDLTIPITTTPFSLNSKGQILITGTSKYVSLLKVGGGTLFVVDTATPNNAGLFTVPSWKVSNDPDCRTIKTTITGEQLAFCATAGNDGIGLVLTKGLSPVSTCKLVTLQAQNI